MSQMHAEESLLDRRPLGSPAALQGGQHSDFIGTAANRGDWQDDFIDEWDDDTIAASLQRQRRSTKIERISTQSALDVADGEPGIAQPEIAQHDDFIDEWDDDTIAASLQRQRRSTKIERRSPPEEQEVADGGPQVAQAPMAPASNLVNVPVERPTTTLRVPDRVEGEQNFAGAEMAGIGRLGGWRGFGRAAMRNPLALFPRRLWRGLRGLWSGITRAFGRWRGRRAQAREAAAQAVPIGPEPLPQLEPEAIEPGLIGPESLEGEAPAGGGEDAGAAPVGAPEPPPTLAVDPQTRYGQHVLAQHAAREDLARYRQDNPGPVRMPAAPEGSMLATLRAGQPLGPEASGYISAARAKAADLEEQYEQASPERTENYPFSQRTLADVEHSGAARAGQVATQIGAAINDRDDVLPDPKKDPKAAAALKALNITANLGKSGMKYVDEKLREYGDSDYKEKIAGTTGKAFIDLQKTGQFYGGFIGKDLANGIDAATDSHAGAHFFKENPALIPNTWDRVGRNADGSIGFGPGVGPATHVEILPGSNGGPAWNYDKNVNMLAAGKFLEHPSTIAQAIGTAVTNSQGRPDDQAHTQRADLLSRQFQTSVYRRMMAANQEAGEGERPFPNATAKMWQAIAREHKAATALGKPMVREGYSSNYALPFARTANLNDRIHHRRGGIALQKALADRQAAQEAEQPAEGMTAKQLQELSPLTWKPRQERDPVFEGALKDVADRDEVPGRVVRRREGAGRGLAHVGNALGTTLDVAGGVLAFDGGESDLKEGNLKTAGAKAALSEIYQNGATAGLGYVPGVGKYAKTFGLAALTPAGTGLQKVGKGLKDIAFGKEERDREYNQHWGLVDPYALEDGDMRAHQRWEERQLSNQMSEERSAFATARGAGDPDRMKDRRQRYLDMMQQARGLEGDLGRSRRRSLARTGYVERPRAEVGGDLNTRQIPLTEAQLAAHRERYPSSLSAALPREVPVYAQPFKPAARPVQDALVPAPAEPIGEQKRPAVNRKDPDLFNIMEEDEEGELESTGSHRQPPRVLPLIEEEEEEDAAARYAKALEQHKLHAPLITEEEDDPFR